MSKYIKKADYIAKYGEEAWAIKSAKNVKRNKMWREEHTEERKEYCKRYRKEHKEECNEYSRQYYKENPEYFSQYHKEHDKQYREENKAKITVQQKNYKSSQWGRAVNLKGNYISIDKKKGFPTDQVVDADWIVENIFGSQCIYCGDSDWTKLGADRIDNTKGHTPDNIVCACESCNESRGDKFTVEEFIQYRKLHPREQPIPDADDKVIGAWIGKFKISSKSIRV